MTVDSSTSHTFCNVLYYYTVAIEEYSSQPCVLWAMCCGQCVFTKIIYKYKFDYE